MINLISCFLIFSPNWNLDQVHGAFVASLLFNANKDKKGSWKRCAVDGEKIIKAGERIWFCPSCMASPFVHLNISNAMFTKKYSLTGGHQNPNGNIHVDYYNSQVMEIFSWVLPFKLVFKKVQVAGKNNPSNRTQWIWDREVSPLPVIAAEENINVFCAMFEKYSLHLSRAEEEG